MTTSQLGRTKLVVWPDLSEPEGPSLVNGIQAAVAEMSNNAPSRIASFAAIADATVSELDHNLGLNLNQLTVLIYSGSHPSFTRIQDPLGIAVPWTIAEKAGSEKLVLEITTPASGGPHTFAVVVLHDVAKDFHISQEQVAVAGNITLRDKVLYLVDTSAARTLTLPAVSTQLYIPLKDVTGTASGFNVLINSPGAETIDGAASFSMDSDYQGVAIVSDGVNYFVI